MPNWYWEKKDLRSTPSQAKGMDYKTETRYRQEGVGFIFEVGKTMSLYHLTMATGAVYYHRFYMFHAFQDFPRYLVATCCLFLAGKAEETPKKCRDIVRVVRSLTNDRQYATFGADPREEVMVLERVLLKTIKFDLAVDHPYGSIMKYALSLGEPEKLQKVVQMSWTFVNDSLRTTLCLRWEPEVIAIAVMHLAIKLSKFEIKTWANRKDSHNYWWDQFVDNLDTSDLEDICHQVLDLYGEPPTSAKDKADSPPPETKSNSSAQQRQPSQQRQAPAGSSSSGSRRAPLSSKQPPPPPQQQQPPPLPPPKKTTPPPPKSRPHSPPPPPTAAAAAVAGSSKPPLPNQPMPPAPPYHAPPPPAMTFPPPGAPSGYNYPGGYRGGGGGGYNMQGMPGPGGPPPPPVHYQNQQPPGPGQNPYYSGGGSGQQSYYGNHPPGPYSQQHSRF